MDLIEKILSDPDSLNKEERHYLIYAGAILASFESMFAVMVQTMTYLITENEIEGLRILQQMPAMQFARTLEYYKRIHQAKFAESPQFQAFWKLAQRANDIRKITAHSFPVLWQFADGRPTLIRQVEGYWMVWRKEDQPQRTLEEFAMLLTEVNAAHESAISLFEHVLQSQPLKPEKGSTESISSR
jgi:hypothetical protein